MTAPDRPFRGAQPYRRDDRDIFFARDAETRDLLRRVLVYRGLLLYGAAGTGKTSLIEAGVIPAAAEEPLEPVQVRLRPEPGRELVLDGTPASPDEVRRRVEEASSERPLLLVFDRFEEVVTLFEGSDRLRESQARVIELVDHLLTDARLPVKLLLSFREEHLARILQLLGNHPQLADNHVRLQPPDEEGLREIVRGPFVAHPGRFDPELSEWLAAKLVEGSVRRGLSLSELQRACDRLWEADDPEGVLEHRGLDGVLGGETPAKPPQPERPSATAEHAPLVREEHRLRVLLLAHAAWSALLAIGYLVGGDTSTLGFMPNSFAKDVLFVLLSLLAAWHLRRHGWLTLLVAAGYAGLVVGQITTLIWGGAPGMDVLGIEVSGTAALLAWMAVDILLAVWFTAWWVSAVRARWGLRFLHPVSFLSLIALSEVLIEGEREVVPPHEIAASVDGYLARLDARGKTRVQLGLAVLAVWPIFTLRPPLPTLAPDARKRFLERRFLADVSQRRTFAPLRPLVQAMIRLGSQMSYLGYYGDRRSWPSIGYQPYSERPGGRLPGPGDQPDPALVSLTAPPRTEKYDAIVIGSGAAGGILAYRFAQAGRRVLVLERGPHVDPRDFSEDEVGQYLRLYNEGALQLATDFRLSVLQGMCVGGGTTVNNALCLEPPEAILENWRGRGVDPAAVRAAIGEVREFLPVGPLHETNTTSVAARRFADAAYGLRLPGRVELMEVNISERCLGCGYCNIGCAFGAKLSMLDTALPWAQRDFPGRLDVLPHFEATRIVYDGDRAVAVEGRYGSGETLSIPADEIAIAAGAVHSSHLLQRSRIGGDLPGRNLHFNINSPLTADYPEPVDAFAGIQMSHAYVPEGGVPGFLLETWFNPPATQALSMPGWFGQHFRNMLRYRHMAAGGALVGTTSPGHVRATRSGPEIHYAPSKTDLRRLVDGLQLMGRIFLAAGADRVMPATYAWHEFRHPTELAELDAYVRDNADLLITSAHPQGGNAIGDVVDPDFRVRGFRNLYLCDASVFPTSVQVNPQLTVMGMAQLAARSILDGDLPAPAANPARRIVSPR